MTKLTDLTFYVNKQFAAPSELVKSQYESLGYVWHLQKRLSIQVIKHVSFEAGEVIDGVAFYFFKGNNRVGHFSLKTIRHLRADPSDIILVQGLIFPIQVIILRVLLGKKTKIIVQHHGERPFPWHKRWLQKMADSCTSAYIFTSTGNARAWLEAKVIKKKDKCFEIVEASTSFVKQEKDHCKDRLGLTGDWNFLWVGRLNPNKDPLSVLSGFEKYLLVNPLAKLYMIYQTDELLEDMVSLINNSELLTQAVHLVGKVQHENLLYWYSASDVFISGSHREGSGFALIEAMSCGCLPVVTEIPTFKKITANGKHALLYETGNSDQLFDMLTMLHQIDKDKMSADIVEYFKRELSFEAIAGRLYELCQTIIKNAS